MPTVWIKFQLPEEEQEYLEASFGTSFCHAMLRICEDLRAAIKYNPNHLTEEQQEGVEHARDIVMDELSERGLLRLIGY